MLHQHNNISHTLNIDKLTQIFTGGGQTAIQVVHKVHCLIFFLKFQCSLVKVQMAYGKGGDRMVPRWQNENNAIVYTASRVRGDSLLRTDCTITSSLGQTPIADDK